jgi:hypothetical protein
VQLENLSEALDSARLAYVRAAARIGDARAELERKHPTSDASAEAMLDEWQEASATIGRLLAEARTAVSQVNEALGLTSAQDRLLRYLQLHLHEPVPGAALSGVAAIHEWGRRIRELRVEQGWPIESGVQRPDLSYDEYVLTAQEPDAALAQRWRTAATIRKMKTSGKNRLLAYLTEISPAVADQDELSYVAQIKSWQRRLRELDEEGWEIRSNIDEPSLAPGSYRLSSLTRRPPRARQAIRLRYKVLERDGFRCGDCGTPRGRGVRLEVHHVEWVSRGGQNDFGNLLTLCNACHAGRHAVDLNTTSDELLNSGVEALY